MHLIIINLSQKHVVLKFLKKTGFEVETRHKDLLVQRFFVPFHFNKTDQNGIWRNARRIPYLSLNDIEAESRRRLKTDIRQADRWRNSWPKTLDKQAINNRNWAIPVVSFDSMPDDKAAARAGLRSLIASVIYDRCDEPVRLKELEVTSEWKFGLCCVGSERRHNEKSRLDAIYYRVAIKKFVKFQKVDEESESEKLEDRRKYLVWCLDELKSNIHWMASVGLVYELPEMLSPDVIPWHARHIWYVSPKLKSVEKWTSPETYFSKIDDQSIETQIRKFKDQWMNYEHYSLVGTGETGNGDCRFQPVPGLPWSHFGDIEIKERRTGMKVVQTFEFWWKKVLESKNESIEATETTTKEKEKKLAKLLKPTSKFINVPNLPNAQHPKYKCK